MENVFKLHSGESVDAIKYTREVLAKHSLLSDVKLYVGCDSQNKRYVTSYVVVLAYRYGARGTHYIYTRIDVPKIRERWSKLSKEVEYSLQLAGFLKENGIEVNCIDFDFNSKEIERSHDLVAWAQGYASALGYNSTVKPEEQVASRAADHLVKRSDGSNRKKFRRPQLKAA
jgi:predicted RNase H-related nuclease YkuK (DUF458 family)